MSRREKLKTLHKNVKFLWLVIGILGGLYIVYITRDFWTYVLTPNPEELRKIVWVIPVKQYFGQDWVIPVGEFIAGWDWPEIVRFVVSVAVGGLGGIVGIWRKYVTPLLNKVKELEEENRTLKEKLEGLLLGKVTPEEVAKKIKPPEKTEEKPEEKPAEEEEKPEEEKAPTPEEVEKAIAVLEAYRKLRGKK